MSPSTPSFGRRRLLAGAGLGLAGIGGLTALSGCGGAGPAAEIPTEVADLPTYTPITEGPAPDLPGNGSVQPAFFTAPQPDDLFPSVQDAQAPSMSDPVSAFVLSYAPPAPEDNSFLEEARTRLGTDLTIQITPADSFSQKFATMVAGGDIPDLVEFLSFGLPPNNTQLLEAQFADLSDLVGGDAIADYPNLANIPAASWESCRFNGRIYGVPIHRPPFGSPLIARPDLFAEITGEEPAPTSRDEFTELLKAVTDPRAGRYAITGQSGGDSISWGYDFMGAMHGVPNGWELVDGKLIHRFESEGWLPMLDYVKSLWEAGVYHPDTPSISNSQAKADLASGTSLLHQDGISALLDTTSPETTYGAIVPFAADGGPGILYQGSSTFGFTAMKKADEARLVGQLKILNYLAAPFGSEEAYFLQYGIEGEHHTRAADGTLARTDAGEAQIGPSALNYLAAGPQVLSTAVPMEDRLTRDHAWQTAAEPMLLKSPVAGLDSPTESKSSSASGAVLVAMDEYILGRDSLDAVTAAIDSWRSAVGDAIREEYTAQLD